MSINSVNIDYSALLQERRDNYRVLWDALENRERNPDGIKGCFPQFLEELARLPQEELIERSRRSMVNTLPDELPSQDAPQEVMYYLIRAFKEAVYDTLSHDPAWQEELAGNMPLQEHVARQVLDQFSFWREKIDEERAIRWVMHCATPHQSIRDWLWNNLVVRQNPFDPLRCSPQDRALLLSGLLMALPHRALDLLPHALQNISTWQADPVTVLRHMAKGSFIIGLLVDNMPLWGPHLSAPDLIQILRLFSENGRKEAENIILVINGDHSIRNHLSAEERFELLKEWLNRYPNLLGDLLMQPFDSWALCCSREQLVAIFRWAWSGDHTIAITVLKNILREWKEHFTAEQRGAGCFSTRLVPRSSRSG